MNIEYRKALPEALPKVLLAALTAALIAAPGWAIAEQSQPSEPGSEQSQPPMSAPSGTSGGTTTGSGTGTGGAAPAQQQMPPTSTAPAPQPQADSALDKQLFAKTPNELDGIDVIGANGQDLGKVDRVVRDRVDSAIYAVISSGGILGYGGREVAVPLDELQLNADKLQMSATEEDLKAKPEYVAEQYVDLQPPDRPISEFSAFESAPPTGGGATTTP